MLERMIDRLAHELKHGSSGGARRNLMPPFDNGYAVVTGLTYDSGNYQGALDKALNQVGYGDLRAEQARLRQQGRYWASASRPTWRSVASGLRRWPARSGSRAGCGRARSFASIQPARSTSSSARRRTDRAKRRRSHRSSPARSACDVNDVKVIHGDTDTTPMGWGTYGSRTTAVGGAALAVGDRQDQGQSQDACRAPARGGARGHRLPGRQILREGRPADRRRFRTSR